MPGQTPEGEQGQTAESSTTAIPRRPARSRPWAGLHAWLHRNPFTSLVTKVVITTVGGLVLLAGLVMLVTPGPGLVALVVGFAILATEWAWAERWVRRAKAWVHASTERARRMDPAVRRRRILLALALVVALVAAVLGYLALFDWPGLVVDAWDAAQGWASFLPDLPGM